MLQSEIAPGQKTGHLSIPSVLIIDDDMTSGLMLEWILTKEGFSVARAQNGMQGRELAEQLQPDLILLDVNMPDENGMLTCEALKRNPVTTDIPVVFISAMENIETKVEGFKVGGVDYITKPYHPSEVLARVRLHIRLRQAYRMMIDSYIYQLKSVAQAQQMLLVQPQELPEARFAVCYASLQQAGGDFYDVIQSGGGIFDYVVVDISGHNAGAALATAAIKAILRQNVSMLYSPLENLNLLNRHIRSVLQAEQYATLVYARLNRPRRQLMLLSAGHPAALLLHANGKLDALSVFGDVLGIFDSIILECQEIKVEEGDRLFLFSDGLIEQNCIEMISRKQGMPILQDLCIQTGRLPLDQAVKVIVNGLLPDCSRLDDDIVLVVIDV